MNIKCNQGNQNNLKNILDKFNLYGISDFNYYEFKNEYFSLKNLLITYYRPLKHFVCLFFLSFRSSRLKFILFIIIITVLRYRGLFNEHYKNLLIR